MQQVTVDKFEAIEKIKANLEIFQKEYDNAVSEFKYNASERLLMALNNVKSQGSSVHLSISAPIDYSSEYLKVIEMLEMSTVNQVVLTNDEFSKYIRNEWTFMRQLKDLRMTYASLNNTHG